MASSFNQYRLHVEMAKAIGHESRMMILVFLLEGEMCVGDLVEKMALDRATVSKHLSVLKAAELVEDRKQATKVYYKVSSPSLLSVFKGLNTLVQERLERYQGYTGFVESAFQPEK